MDLRSRKWRGGLGDGTVAQSTAVAVGMVADGSQCPMASPSLSVSEPVTC